MIGCLRTCVRKQPIIALNFESENVLKFYNLEARKAMFIISKSGFCPFNPDVIDPMNFKPYVPLQQHTEDMPICTPATDSQPAPGSSSGFLAAKRATVRTKSHPPRNDAI